MQGAFQGALLINSLVQIPHLKQGVKLRDYPSAGREKSDNYCNYNQYLSHELEMKPNAHLH